MKTRIITGLVAGVLLLAVLLLPAFAAYCAFSVICAMAVWEMFAVLGLTKDRPLTILSVAVAAAIPLCGLFESVPLFYMELALYGMLLVGYQLYRHDALAVKDTATAFFMTLVLSLGISCAVYCRAMDDFGLMYLLIVLLIAWGSDMGAYFTGSFFGKHKLCPAISPKKTVEGFFGGWIFGVVSALAVVLVWDLLWIPETAVINYWKIALLAFVLSPFSVMGDLFASIVKRQVGAKDYGNIMPGHGGVMDRFDSLIFVAPLFFAALQVMTLVQGV